ncbi:MAG: hypothetical protein IJG41_02750 [Bacteroidales bacterium]|nr:hypothetical protein [Bacteroidales bacterium]
MSAIKEKQQQEKELLTSRSNLMLADFLLEMHVLETQGVINSEDFQKIKEAAIVLSRVNDVICTQEIKKDLSRWVLFLRIGLVDKNEFCKGIVSIVEQREEALPVLLSNDGAIKGNVVNLCELGCQLVGKSISSKKTIIVMKKAQYRITITRYKRLFGGDWDKKIEMEDINGKKYKYSLGEIYSVLRKV